MNNILFKILMLKGDAGEPTDEQTQSAVDDYMQAHPEAAIDETIINSAVSDWLDDHPEATTTVQDGSLTEAKLSDALKLKVIKDYVTPEMFGAKGDGVTDDTLAIRNAVNSGYKIIVFSPKTYLLNPSSFESHDGYTTKIGIQLPSNVTLIGNGATLKIAEYTLDTTYAILATDNYRSAGYEAQIPWQNNISISGITIDGNSANSENEHSLIGIALYKCNDIMLDNIVMTNLCGTDGSGYGVIFAYCNRVFFYNGSIDKSSRSNIYCWESQYVKCENLTLNGSIDRDCVTCGANETLALQKSIIYFNNCHMEHLFDTGTHVARFPKDVDAVLENCTLIGNANIDGIAIPRVSGSVSLLVKNCTVKNCTVGINATGQNTYTKIVLENNSISGVDAFVLGAIQELYAHNNYFESTGASENKAMQGGKGFISNNIFKAVWGIIFNFSIIQETVNNYFDSFTTNSYWAIVSNGYCNFSGNIASDATKYVRIYSNGKAIGNHLKIESTTLDADQYNS